jgi:O-antigen/teichoic acid export membrane protein
MELGTLEQIIRRDFKKEINLLDQALVSGGNFLISILITRLMGIEVFGLYSAGYVLVYLFFSVHNAWIISPLLSIKPIKRGDELLLYSNGLFYHHLVFSIMVAFIVYLIIMLPFETTNPLYGEPFAFFLPLFTFLYDS